MAVVTVYSVGYTKFRANQKVAPGTWKPDCCYDTYEAGVMDSTSTVYMFRPPKGARFKDGYLMTDDLGGTATTLAVGIVGATTKFLAATNHGDGAVKSSFPLIAAIDQVGYEFDGETDVILTVGASNTVGGTIVLVMNFFGTAI